MNSFRVTGDFKYKEVWSKIPKEAEDVSFYDSILTDTTTKKPERDDYLMAKVNANLRYCDPLFNMTAIQIDLGKKYVTE
jgi:hypothetical protein